MTAYYIPNNALLPTMHRFIRTRSASYATHCNVFSINLYAIIKITITGTCTIVPLYKFAAKQPKKKNINQG